MRNYFLSMGLVLGLGASATHAAPLAVDLGNALKAIQALDLAESAANVINWKVGDFHKIKVDFLFGGGAGRKEATKEDKARNAVWLKTDISIMGQNQTTEALIDRSNGQVLELIVNGEKQEVGQDGEIEIVEQKETEITVPAGKFDCMYVKANITSQGQKSQLELWANSIDVNLDGTLKLILGTQFGPLTMTLEQFGPR